MTLENTLLEKLANWRPRSRDTLLTSVPESLWTVSITADRCEGLGCQLWEVAVRRPPAEPPLDLHVWAQRLEQANTGLLELFKLIEIDASRQIAQLRSEAPAHRGEHLQYYELIMEAQGAATLRRYQSQYGNGKRDQIPFVLTHEVLARLATLLTAEK